MTIAEVIADIRVRDPAINAFTALTEARALAREKAVDPALPLAGIPFAAKNLFDIRGLSTLAGSKINRDRPPAVADAPLIRRLEKAGAILLGALNMDE
ncbi:MAG: AtzE family amidohydrolase, partial [Betaproteobacteria bacterium]|nr:AtzE family amidohydrolase [Betaproteobacteria bacterium]